MLCKPLPEGKHSFPYGFPMAFPMGFPHGSPHSEPTVATLQAWHDHPNPQGDAASHP